MRQGIRPASPRLACWMFVALVPPAAACTKSPSPEKPLVPQASPCTPTPDTTPSPAAFHQILQEATPLLSARLPDALSNLTTRSLFSSPPPKNGTAPFLSPRRRSHQ